VIDFRVLFCSKPKFDWLLSTELWCTYAAYTDNGKADRGNIETCLHLDKATSKQVAAFLLTGWIRDFLIRPISIARVAQVYMATRKNTIERRASKKRCPEFLEKYGVEYDENYLWD